MKKQMLLLFRIGLLAFVSVAVLADLPPRTVPSKPQKIPFLNPGLMDGAQMQAFRFAGKEHHAMLRDRDIKASPEWNPASPLPLGLDGIEAAARGELNRFVTDGSEWEISNIHLNRLSDSDQQRWYYAVTFIPELRLTGIPPDEVVVLLTIDGKPGHSF
jgi:hypothetical protein